MGITDCKNKRIGIEDSRIYLFQAEDGIRDLVRSRGLGDVYKRQVEDDLPMGERPAGDSLTHGNSG